MIDESKLPALTLNGVDLQLMRVYTNKTKRDMAKAAGLRTITTYSKWEEGISEPSVNQFFSIARACGFTPNEIVDVLISEDRVKAMALFAKVVSRR